MKVKLSPVHVGRSLPLFLSALVLAGCASSTGTPKSFPPDAVSFLGLAAVPGGRAASPDKSGLPHELLEDGQSYADAFDGFGSGFAYTGRGNRYLALCDRGPNKVQYAGGEAFDFTTSYPNRFQWVDVEVKAVGGEYRVSVVGRATSLLTDEGGRPFTGKSDAFSGPDPDGNARLDSEGIRMDPSGHVWISDEYGPVVYEFDQSGKRVGTLALPPAFLVAHPAPTLAEEMETNKSGRYTNRGAEGLAMSPDGERLVVAMQGPLVQDGGLKGSGLRFLVYDLAAPSAGPAQYVYVLDDLKTAVSEILAINSHQFLVDERDGVPGAKGRKLLYFVDLDQSPRPTEVSKVEALPLGGRSDSIVPLRKVLFADLGAILNAAAPFASPAGLPDKIEGIAFGPDLPDGRHLLLATNDNDYASTFPNYVFAFAVARDALPGLQVPRLAKGVGLEK